MKTHLRMLRRGGTLLTLLILASPYCRAQALATAQQIPHRVSQEIDPAGKKLRDVLQTLKTHYNVDILFEGGLVKEIIVPADELNLGAKLEQNLDLILRGTNLRYRKVKKGTYLIVTAQKQAKTVDANPTNTDARPADNGSAVTTTTLKPAQQLSRQLSGRVLTDDGGAGLPGVNITLKGTSTGTVTDTDGKYNLTIPDDNVVLVFSFIGYLTQEIAVGDRTTLDVKLVADVKSLSEVVVVGYGSVKKSDLTGSVASVSSEKLTQVKGVSNVAQALQGQAAGVQANQRSGQPGESVIIKIRGTNSIAGGNDPLYVVDGQLLTGLSAQLNPDDIESIEVLKDASSTAIYGSRGSNGVIIITTKKGKTGKVQVSYNGYYGVQTLRKKVDLINASEFAQLQNEVATNDGKPLPWTQAQISSFGQGTDWQDLVYKDASVQNHDISISGGSATTKYYTSFGYFDQKGIILNSGFKRLSFRANLDQKINEKLNLTTSMSLQNSTYVQANYAGADGGGGIPFTTMVIPPTQGVYDANGKYTRFTGVPWGETNPVGISTELYNPSVNTRLIGNAALTYTIVSGLRLKVSAGIDGNYNKSDYYAPSTLSIGQPGGRAAKNYGNGISFVNENLLSYTRGFGKNFLDAVGGITYQSDKTENLNSGTAVGFISDIYQNNNLGTATTKAQPGTGYQDFKLISYLGRVNYNYDSRYFVTVTGRYDGSSKFGEDNKFAFFPSGALAWRISQESFMQNLQTVSNLKLRASYGLSGNQAISPYRTLARLSNNTVVFDNQINTGFVLGGLSNNGLKWETTRQLDLGVDLGLWNNRVQLTADYYYKKTTDLLLEVTLPTSTGFGAVLQNVGAVENKGVEFELLTNNTTGAVKWTSTLTLSHNNTKVLDLGNDAQGRPITYKEVGSGGNWFPMIVGQPMSQLYGYQVLGVYQTNEEAAQNGEPTKKAGDYKFWDRDGNGTVDGNDRSTLTNLNPKFTFGFNNSVSFKNFDLSVLFVGSYGNDIVNEFRKYNITMNGNWAPSRAAFEQRWRGAGTSNAIDRPSATSGSSIRDYANSLWVENGSYLRLRDITLGYTVSPNILKAIRLASLRVYVSAQNFLTISNYTGYDPEASNSAAAINGWDRGVYPSTKSITGGVKINF